ncbi:MAG: rod shape-determining protein MreC [Candidatus Levybacteria bacterium]|nr:rod shape-determining protein MreC [Candidatus Levybacteria bacterium]
MDRKRKRQYLILILVIFFLLSIGFYATQHNKYFRKGYEFIENETIMIQRLTYRFYLSFFHATSSVEQLEKENRILVQKLIDKEKIEKDNIALRSQFQTTYPEAITLLPAAVIGMKSFVPGISVPDGLILDKGSQDNVHAGDVVVYENILIGRVAKVSLHLSLIYLMTGKDTSITVKTAKTGALGLIKGQGKDMVLDNVLLSEKLEISDMVVSKGDVAIDGTGVPPDLIIGKIVSIDKKTSELFQTAKIESIVDVTKLSMVFILQ